jgi:hypothetical protein
MTEEDIIYDGSEEPLAPGEGVKCTGYHKVEFSMNDEKNVAVIVQGTNGMSDADVQGEARRQTPQTILDEVAGDTNCVTYECCEECIAVASWSNPLIATTIPSAPQRFNVGTSIEFAVVHVKLTFEADISAIGSCECPES